MNTHYAHVLINYDSLPQSPSTSEMDIFGDERAAYLKNKFVLDEPRLACTAPHCAPQSTIHTLDSLLNSKNSPFDASSSAQSAEAAKKGDHIAQHAPLYLDDEHGDEKNYLLAHNASFFTLDDVDMQPSPSPVAMDNIERVETDEVSAVTRRALIFAPKTLFSAPSGAAAAGVRTVAATAESELLFGSSERFSVVDKLLEEVRNELDPNRSVTKYSVRRKSKGKGKNAAAAAKMATARTKKSGADAPLPQPPHALAIVTLDAALVARRLYRLKRGYARMRADGLVILRRMSDDDDADENSSGSGTDDPSAAHEPVHVENVEMRERERVPDFTPVPTNELFFCDLKKEEEGEVDCVVATAEARIMPVIFFDKNGEPVSAEVRDAAAKAQPVEHSSVRKLYDEARSRCENPEDTEEVARRIAAHSVQELSPFFFPYTGAAADQCAAKHAHERSTHVLNEWVDTGVDEHGRKQPSFRLVDEERDGDEGDEAHEHGQMIGIVGGGSNQYEEVDGKLRVVGNKRNYVKQYLVVDEKLQQNIDAQGIDFVEGKRQRKASQRISVESFSATSLRVRDSTQLMQWDRDFFGNGASRSASSSSSNNSTAHASRARSAPPSVLNSPLQSPRKKKRVTPNPLSASSAAVVIDTPAPSTLIRFRVPDVVVSAPVRASMPQPTSLFCEIFDAGDECVRLFDTLLTQYTEYTNYVSLSDTPPLPFVLGYRGRHANPSTAHAPASLELNRRLCALALPLVRGHIRATDNVHNFTACAMQFGRAVTLSSDIAMHVDRPNSLEVYPGDEHAFGIIFNAHELTLPIEFEEAKKTVHVKRGEALVFDKRVRHCVRKTDVPLQHEQRNEARRYETALVYSSSPSAHDRGGGVHACNAEQLQKIFDEQRVPYTDWLLYGQQWSRNDCARAPQSWFVHVTGAAQEKPSRKEARDFWITNALRKEYVDAANEQYINTRSPNKLGCAAPLRAAGMPEHLAQPLCDAPTRALFSWQTLWPSHFGEVSADISREFVSCI